MVSSAGGGAQTAGALRDKIAKFERKGGVPVPRGSFGLGAPPTVEGPRKRGELYGNRISAPARVVSASIIGINRPASPTGTSTFGSPEPSPGASPIDQRRSFSLSSIMSDVDEGADYTPITSPTFAFPPDSPESLASLSYTPEASPSLSTNGDVGIKYNIVRGTSFQKALEIARNAEQAKLEEALRPQMTGELRPQMTGELRPQMTGELRPQMTGGSMRRWHDFTMPTPQQPPLEDLAELRERVSYPNTEPPQESPVEESKPETVVNTAAAIPLAESLPAIAESSPPSPITEISTVVPIESSSTEETSPPTPSPGPITVETKESEPQAVHPVIIEVAPLTLRKRAPPEAVSVRPAVEETLEPLPEPIQQKEEVLVLPSIAIQTPPAPALEQEVAPSPPEIFVNDETTVSEPVTVQEVAETYKSNELAARKAALTLDADRIANDSLMSPPVVTGNMSTLSLTDVFSNYFTGGNPTGTFRSTTPPPLPKDLPDPPMSPMATLAYDAPESPQPPARPRIKAPDLASFLSPPASGFLSAVPTSGGSSMGSMSSMGSRPMSMFETSPGHVARALRMTPATSRGVPMFLPPNNSRPRKSDFVYFPPTPDEEDTALEEAEAEFGVVTIGHRRRGSEPDLMNTSARPGFSAVVHGKVREVPASATMPSSRPKPLPETPQIRRTKRATILEPPLSPGQGELAALLQEAVLLEDVLDKGELPSETLKPRLEALEERKKDAEARAKAKTEEQARLKEEERQRIAYATAQLQAKRDQPTEGRLKHTFLIPLSKARTGQSVHRKEVSTSHGELFPHKPQDDLVVRPKSAGLPDQSGVQSAREDLAVVGQKTKSLRPKTPDTSAPSIPEMPSKSPKSSRFASFKRLGSISRPGTTSGHPARHSNSTSSEISSEDSAAAVTPPDNNLEFGTRASPINEFGYMQNAPVQSSSTSFPSLSPKKSTSGMGRATSFAEKMWSRARTKSNGSTLSATSDVTGMAQVLCFKHPLNVSV